MNGEEGPRGQTIIFHIKRNFHPHTRRYLADLRERELPELLEVELLVDDHIGECRTLRRPAPPELEHDALERRAIAHRLAHRRGPDRAGRTRRRAAVRRRAADLVPQQGCTVVQHSGDLTVGLREGFRFEYFFLPIPLS